MQQQLAIYTIANDRLLADWSNRVLSCNVRSNVHGYESCEAEIDIPFYEAFLYYQQLGPLKLKVSWGSYRVWEGRLDDPNQFTRNGGSGLRIVAFGGWVAYNDAPYTALWSITQFDQWYVYDQSFNPLYVPEAYTLEASSRLVIAPLKNNTYSNAGILGGWYRSIPHNSTRQFVGITFDYEVLAPANWEVGLVTRPSNSAIWVLATTGALQRGTINITFTADITIQFYMYYNAAAAVFAGDTGSAYFRITSVRAVTSIANRINTTLGTNIAAGTRTVTPGSMSRIYVGQKLQIDQGSATIAETIIVTAITATTFTAVFAFAHVIASTVIAHVIYPDEIIKDCVTMLNTLNPTQVNSDLSLIQSQAIDLDQAIYEDQYPADIINEVLAKGDTTGRQWVAQVYNDQRLVVRARGGGKAWYADVTSLDVVRTLSELYNSVYAVYNDVSNNQKLRTTISTDAASVTKFGITRRKALPVDTTSGMQASYLRDTLLALQKDPIPRASITLDRIFDSSGSAHPLHFVHSDDTVTIRNLPPILGGIYDKIRTLVITKTDYDIVNDRLTLDLELPQPQMEILLAQALKESRT